MASQFDRIITLVRIVSCMSAPTGSSRRKKRSRQSGGMTSDAVVASFVACPRCSFFLTGYRLINTDFDTAVDESVDGWLDFSWNHDTRRLILKNFGYRIDTETTHFEGICQDCRRVLIFKDAEEERESAMLRVEIVPG